MTLSFLLLTACTQKLVPSTTELTPSHITLSAILEDNHRMVLQIQNQGERDYFYGYDFQLEREKEGTWYQVPFRENSGIIAIGVIIAPQSTNEMTLSLDDYFASLPHGHYRVVKSFSSEEGIEWVAIEFEIMS